MSDSDDKDIESKEEKEQEEEEIEEEEEKEEQEKNPEIINIEEKEDKQNDKKKKDKNKNKKSKEQKSKEPCNGIFINGIPYETTEEELKELFSPFGEIEQIKLPKYQDSGRNIGYCHIYYTSVDSANKALELDNYTLGKRYLKISLANKSSNELNKTQKINPNDVPVNCLTAFIRNLPYESTEKEIGDKFRSCGKIKGIRMVYNSKNKKFKGFCYIDFKEHNGLLKALELNGKDFQGRKLQVDFEENKPKKGYKYNYQNMEAKYNREEINLLNRKRKMKNKK
jgi:nucleolin